MGFAGLQSEAAGRSSSHANTPTVLIVNLRGSPLVNPLNASLDTFLAWLPVISRHRVQWAPAAGRAGILSILMQNQRKAAGALMICLTLCRGRAYEVGSHQPGGADLSDLCVSEKLFSGRVFE